MFGDVYEVPFHAAYLAFSLICAAAMWSLARRFCNRPEMAALSVLTTPLFLFSSSNVMCDTLLVACLVWAVELWLSGLERPSRTHLAAGALLVGAATLTKYFGASFILLLFVATLLHRRRASSELLFLLIPVAFSRQYPNPAIG